LGKPPREGEGGDRGEDEGDPGELLDAAVTADVVALGGEGAGVVVVGERVVHGWQGERCRERRFAQPANLSLRPTLGLRFPIASRGSKAAD
jgi:hypothetical protein